jgi:hypothetical protein
MLHVLMQNGTSVFYSFGINDSTSLPQLTWVWGPDGFPCAGGDTDSVTELLKRGDQSMIVRDKCMDIVRAPASGLPSDTGFFRTDDDRHNSGLYLDDHNVVIDFTRESEGRDSSGERYTCELVGLEFLEIPASGPAAPASTADMNLPNEVKGLASRNDTLYIADHKSTMNCKAPGEPVHFRVFSTPKNFIAYQDITPTIETINGIQVYSSASEMPDQMCGSQPVFCTSYAECAPSGICVGGICAQPPILDVGDDQILTFTGT